MFTLLNHATVCLQLTDFEKTHQLLKIIDVAELGQRAYLYYGCYAEYYMKIGEKDLSISFLDKALAETTNSIERDFLMKKRGDITC
ncbi:hypothetical protein [Maribacter stanieri]|uniref:hypothetical protein n=1 Tax=Maribacter stanieri TaxID=440514 RepID=UPI002493FF6C|nr:hypothetical protein [Maribacter stanieri]